IGGPAAADCAHALAAIEALRRIYSGTIGYDYDHLRDHEERRWLRDMAESGRFAPPHTPLDGRTLLQRLTQVESFEQFLQ
ncbi:MAG TPA: hypothetical protein PLK31_27200, partial [Chloroflexota bacterium]|nr:hypothetical protein [Chloroflexota bacterium]